MPKQTISVIIRTKNEEKMISDCLETADWADEIIVVDSGSEDKTVVIAKEKGTKVYYHPFTNFADQRNFATQKTKGEWLFYLDADERVSKKLREEIQQKIINPGQYCAFEIPRLNIFFGCSMHHGGWYPDYQTKLIKKEALKEWFGLIHESARVEGKIGQLKNNLLHLSHRSLDEGFAKSVIWTKMEADLLFAANHPKVNIFHLAKVPLEEFIKRVFAKKGFLDGIIGWLEGLIQAFNKFLVYAQLWEKQQKLS